jgi:hypothetical protein
MIPKNALTTEVTEKKMIIKEKTVLLSFSVQALLCKAFIKYPADKIKSKRPRNRVVPRDPLREDTEKNG